MKCVKHYKFWCKKNQTITTFMYEVILHNKKLDGMNWFHKKLDFLTKEEEKDNYYADFI